VWEVESTKVLVTPSKTPRVGIGKFSPKTPAGVAAKVAVIKQEIASGKITNIPMTVK
jgi:hypothetical protein